VSQLYSCVCSLGYNINLFNDAAPSQPSSGVSSLIIDINTINSMAPAQSGEQITKEGIDSDAIDKGSVCSNVLIVLLFYKFY